MAFFEYVQYFCFQIQGPMNWRKTLRHIKSPVQQEIKETADRDQAASVGSNSSLGDWSGSHPDLGESSTRDQTGEMGSDQAPPDRDQAAMVGAASAVKDRRMHHGPRRDDRVKRNINLERRPSNKSLVVEQKYFFYFLQFKLNTDLYVC